MTWFPVRTSLVLFAIAHTVAVDWSVWGSPMHLVTNNQGLLMFVGAVAGLSYIVRKKG